MLIKTVGDGKNSNNCLIYAGGEYLAGDAPIDDGAVNAMAARRASCAVLLGVETSFPTRIRIKSSQAPAKVCTGEWCSNSGCLIAVYSAGIECATLYEVKGGWITGYYRAIEARATTRVAGACALLANVKNKGVLVAVGTNLKDLLGVSGGSSLVP